MNKGGSSVPVPESDSSGRHIMTKKYVSAKCEYDNGFSTPELNDKLNLSGVGFEKITDALLPYTGLKSLNLQMNSLQSMQGLQHMEKLKTLFLNDNMLTKIEGLERLSFLDTLVLSNNHIKKIEGLSKLKFLTKLDMTKNSLSDYTSVCDLLNMESLKTLKLASNSIEEDEKILKLMGSLKVVLLELQDNPIVGLPDYRKRLIVANDNLGYLDDRPVDDKQRRAAEAFLSGGQAKEEAEYLRIQQEKKARELAESAARKQKIEAAKSAQGKVDLDHLPKPMVLTNAPEQTLKWTGAMTQKLLYMAHKYNEDFVEIQTHFNKYLEEEEDKTGIILVKQTAIDLSLKYYEILQE